MRKDLVPGEQVIVTTRPQPRKLSGAAAAFILAPAGAAYTSAWIIRGEAARLFPGLTSRWTPWLVIACVLAAVAVWAGYCLPRLLRWQGTRYILTSRRLVSRSGMLRRQDQQVNLASVRNLTVHESVLQRLLRSGNISLETGYQGVVTFQDVPEVARFRDFILDAIGELPDERDGQPGGTTDYPAGALPWDVREGGQDER
ncbi:PH domain-containing protein [Pseudarthrobacter sp. NamB4]|uniref:PH domain-containing protein n=1 Tax=Pseudarthrobacter sp. NamB4 TaxID=2576837 RepID=UPI0010FD0B70|nr:PH domain-containing protein [Pseudarthrobacter sp. NamB4]TLM74198.1 PH domain-containing protein [Pseudarthrobacter sp. NamB4]